MRVAVDTNVLVRYITSDDPAQTRLAEAAIDGDNIIVISLPVLCELVWVLRRPYRHSNAEIAVILSDLIAGQNVEVDRPAAEAGSRMLMRGGDFADGAIEHDAARARCERLVTFDATFARLAAGSSVALLT